MVQQSEDWDDPDREDPDDSGIPKVHLSLDLSEATYNLPFEVIDQQNSSIDVMLGDFAPWRVFHKLFKINQREVDMSDLIEKGYWDGETKVLSQCGTFMGDPLSFIHLTMYLRSLVYASFGKNEKPIGQSVGDDLLLLGVRRKAAETFHRLVGQTGGKLSKFSSISNYGITFCEQYAYSPIDSEQFDYYSTKSRFGDLFFLDIIKGSILTGKTKVSSSRMSPFFGHSRMLNKQTGYHPLNWVRVRATKLLWAANYNAAIKLGSATATLPEILGGIDLSIGTKLTQESDEYLNLYAPWLEGILILPQVPFIAFATLLKGIYKANPKGVPYENSLEDLLTLLPGLQTMRINGISSIVPSFMKSRPVREQLQYIGKVHDMASIDHLVDELARRQAFLAFWRGKKSASRDAMLTIDVNSIRKRHQRTWVEIRRSVNPVPRDRWIASSPEDLASRFKTKLWNVYYSKDAVALKDVYGGMPTLYTSY